MPTENYYNILGISPSATQTEVKKAYRKLAKKHHPDVSKEDGAEAHFKQIVEAYAVLKNKNKRKHYDLSGGYQKPANTGTHFQGVDLNIFADLFSQNTFVQKNTAQKTTTNKTHTSEENKPINQNLIFHIDLEEIAQGVNKHIRLSKHKTVNIKIPKGAEEGKVIRLVKQASTGGDLLVKVKFNPHKQFKHQDKDLFTEITVPLDKTNPPQKLKIPTLNNPIHIKTPEKLLMPHATEHKLRIKGLGLPAIPSSQSGDLFVTIKLKEPQPASKDEHVKEQANHHTSDKYRKDIETLLQEVNELSKTLNKEKAPRETKPQSIECLLKELSHKTNRLISTASDAKQHKIIDELRIQLEQVQKLLS
jgi:curved DNA-binding protein